MNRTSITSRTSVAALGTAALAIAGSLLGAAPASAAQVWIQAVERPSADAPCPPSSDGGSENGWIVSPWAASWEQWPNGGTGGWTCTRTITWALSSPAPEPPAVPDDEGASDEPEDPAEPPVDTCLVYIDGSYWIDIAPNSLVALPASVLYLESGCTGNTVQLNGSGYIVSTTSDEAAAGLCGAGFIIADVPGNADPSLRFCIPRIA